MDKIMAVDKLRFGYGGMQVLEDISFEVNTGEFVGVIGSNGAGKSTLLKLLLGELTPGSGSVSLFGTPVEQFRNWPRIGYVPQNAAAFAGRFPATAFEIVGASLYSKIKPLHFPSKADKLRTLQVLELVGLGELSRRMMDQMSGGQLQRVLIARALVAEPAVLILDEPTAGVDVDSAAALYTLLERLNREGITVLMVTHDTERSAKYLDRALCIEHGTMVALDKAELRHELAHKHHHPHK